jgi:hypothetical protein
VQPQNAAHRRLRIAGDVAVPALAGDALGVLVGMDPQDFRMARRCRRRGMHMERTETSAEVLVLIEREVLITEEDDLVLEECCLDFLERAIVEGPGQVHPRYFGPYSRRQFAYLDGLIGHGVSSRAWVSLRSACE